MSAVPITTPVVIELDTVKTALTQIAQNAINAWDPAGLTLCVNIMTAINTTQTEIDNEATEVEQLPDQPSGGTALGTGAGGSSTPQVAAVKPAPVLTGSGSAPAGESSSGTAPAAS